MRFCDLFICYKIRLKNIKGTIPYTKSFKASIVHRNRKKNA